MSINSNVAFKDYNQKQIILLPPSLEELIEENHPVRVVNNVIDRIDLGPLLGSYKPGGTSVYHPKMLLKVLDYGYLSNIYSSQKNGGRSQRKHPLYVAFCDEHTGS